MKTIAEKCRHCVYGLIDEDGRTITCIVDTPKSIKIESKEVLCSAFVEKPQQPQDK